MRHNRRDDGQLSCRKREMKTMNANTALDGHTTVIKMAERGGVPLIGLASATSQLDQNAWQRVATYKSGSEQTWRRIFFVWNHIEKVQTGRTYAPAQLPLC